MRLRRLIAGFLVVLAALIAGVVVFAFVAPMSFTVTAPGRLEPRRMIRVAFEAPGRLVFLAAGPRVRKGEVVAALDATVEQKSLESLGRSIALLETELKIERAAVAAAGRRLKVEIAAREKELENTRRRLRAESGPLARVDLELVKSEQQERILTAALRRSEEAVLSSLIGQGLVTKMEVELSKHRAALARLEEGQTRLQVDREGLTRGLRVDDLKTSEAAKAAEVQALKDRPPGARSVLEIQRRLVELRAERERVAERIQARRRRAPFDGVVQFASARVGEFAPAGHPVMTLADDTALVFRAETGPGALRDVRLAQKVNLRIDSYPRLTFGAVPGRLERLETRLAPGEPTRVRLEVSVGETRLPLRPGMTGQADVVIYRGTLVSYLMRERRGSATSRATAPPSTPAPGP